VSSDGGPAFPSLEIYEGYDSERGRYEVRSDTATGMSLRDYFAGQVLSAVYAARVEGGLDILQESIAAEAYELADAMIAERSTERAE
jgi:hypothetical protein